MAFTPSFTANQYIGNPIGLVITDTSIGELGNINNRYIYITNAQGQSLVPSGNSNPVYIEWPLSSGNTLTIPILTTDMALEIEIDWVAVVNNARLTQDGSLRITQDSNYRVTQ